LLNSSVEAMPSPDVLLRATVHRLAARLGSGLAEVAAEVAVLAQDAPERLRREWDLFQDEVKAEAERLESDQADPAGASAAAATTDDPQQQIDRLRAQVAALSQMIEEAPCSL
jgi:uncharacterized protein YceH (UPF0502 family)